MTNKAYFDLTALLSSESDIAGLWNSALKGFGGDILGIRPYEPGDKLRHLHRPSFARGELMVKEFFGERNLCIWMFVDITSLTAREGRLESLFAKPAKEAVKLFSALICGAADFCGISIGAICLTDLEPRIIKARQGAACLNELSGAVTEISGKKICIPEESTQALRSKISAAKKSVLFFISDFAGEMEDYSLLIGEAKRVWRIDIIPVFINILWVFALLKEKHPEFAAVDPFSLKVGSLKVNNENVERLEHVFTERESEAQVSFRRNYVSWISLKRPNFQEYVKEITRCFREKQRMSPNA